MSEPAPDPRLADAAPERCDASGSLSGTEPGATRARAVEPAELPAAPSAEDAEREERRCLVEDLASGAIRFTCAGFREYGPRFAQAGIDINSIRTRSAFKQACLESEYIVWRQLRDKMKRSPELMAVMQDFFDKHCLD